MLCALRLKVTLNSTDYPHQGSTTVPKYEV